VIREQLNISISFLHVDRDAGNALYIGQQACKDIISCPKETGKQKDKVHKGSEKRKPIQAKQKPITMHVAKYQIGGSEHWDLLVPAQMYCEKFLEIFPMVISFSNIDDF